MGRYNAFMLTEKFATSGPDSFITGVVYNDNNSNDFYSIGEGVGNVAISFSQGSFGLGGVSSWGSGGYSFGTSETGQITVLFSGGGLPSLVSVTISQGGQNSKLDLIDGDTVQTSVSATLGANAIALKLLGTNNLNASGNELGNMVLEIRAIMYCTEWLETTCSMASWEMMQFMAEAGPIR